MKRLLAVPLLAISLVVGACTTVPSDDRISAIRFCNAYSGTLNLLVALARAEKLSFENMKKLNPAVQLIGEFCSSPDVINKSVDANLEGALQMMLDMQVKAMEGEGA